MAPPIARCRSDPCVRPRTYRDPLAPVVLARRAADLPEDRLTDEADQEPDDRPEAVAEERHEHEGRPQRGVGAGQR